MESSENREIGGRYRLLRRLNQERGSVLWLAHDDELMERVHLRVLQDNLRDEPLVAMQCRREIAVGKRLDHAALAVAREIVDDGGLAVVYERPGRENLATRLSEEGPVDPVVLSLWFEPVLEALEFAHRRGVVHRNLNLRNLWLTDGDTGPPIRISGFGGARLLDRVGLTTHSVALGVSHYRSPEQLRGQSIDVGRDTDIWAIGVMLFELLTGQPPVRTGGPSQLLASFAELNTQDELGDLADTNVGRLVTESLRFDRGQRPSSAGALLEVLRGREVSHVGQAPAEGPACWRCETPRVAGFEFCFECGAEPLIRPFEEGDVSIFVPKMRREDETQYQGFLGARDLLIREFYPGLDAERRSVIYERLRRAAAQVRSPGRERMKTSPFMVATNLTRQEAFEFGEFLRTGESVEASGTRGAVRLWNPDRFDSDEIPIVYRDPSSSGYTPDQLPLWSMTGISWSSPIGNALGGLILSAGFFGCLVGLGEYGIGFIIGATLFWFGPVLGALWLRGQSARKPVARFRSPQRSYHVHRQWQKLVEALTVEQDRQLVRRLLFRGRRRFGGDFSDWGQALWERVGTELEELSTAPAEAQWQQLQRRWEALQLRRRTGSDDGSEQRQRVVEEMAQYECRQTRCELARMRLSYMADSLQTGDTPSHVENLHAQLRLELSALDEEEVPFHLEELRTLHQAFAEVEEMSAFSIPEPTVDDELDLDFVLPERFRLIRILGTGGMARVLLVEDQVRESAVALKVAHSDLNDPALITALFRREYEAARRVHHPGVVSIYEYLKIDGLDALVMEYVEGLDLASLIRCRGSLSGEEVRQIGDQLLQALAAAHRRGVIHGDVKPANLIVGDEGEVTLIDFGLARMEVLVASDLLESQLGTPGYAAPELVESGLVDERVDIYGVALTLLETVSGEVPFSAQGGVKVTVEDWEDRVVDRRLRQVIAGAIAQSPEQRFRSAQEMQLVLRGEALDGPEPGAKASVEHCHGCGVVRVAGLSRCFDCGATTRYLSRRIFARADQVVIESGADEETKENGFLTRDDVASIEAVVEEFPNLETTVDVGEVLSTVPLVFTPGLAPSDAQAVGQALRRKGLDATECSSLGAVQRRVLLGAIPRIASNSLLLTALVPLVVIALFGASLSILTTLLVTDDSSALVMWSVMLAIFAIPLVMVTAVTWRRQLRPATVVSERNTDREIDEIPWELRAFEIGRKASSQRSSDIVSGLVSAAAACRQRWKDDALRGDLVAIVDDLVERALSDLEEMVQAEQALIDESSLGRSIGRINDGKEEPLANRKGAEQAGEEAMRRRLEGQLEEGKKAREQVIEIGTRMIEVTRALEGLVGHDKVADETDLDEVVILLDHEEDEVANVASDERLPVGKKR